MGADVVAEAQAFFVPGRKRGSWEDREGLQAGRLARLLG